MEKLTEAHYYYDRAAIRDKMGYVSIPPGIDPDAYMIRRVLEAETQAGSITTARKWVPTGPALPMPPSSQDEGGKAYDITATEIGEMVDRLSTQKPNKPGTTFTNTNYHIRPSGLAAWAKFRANVPLSRRALARLQHWKAAILKKLTENGKFPT